MTEQHAQPQAPGRQQGTLPQEERERKQRVLTKGRSSITRSIAEAVVVKQEDLFFLAERDGSVPVKDSHGFGLYYHDCRYLNGYELRLAGTEPHPLVSTAARGYMAVFELTNPDIRMPDGSLIPKEDLGIKWTRTVDADQPALHDVISIENFGLTRVQVTLSLTFSAGFEDIYAVRGLLVEKPGRLHRPSWDGGVLRFAYDGADGIRRSLDVHFDPEPARTEGTTAEFSLELHPREQVQVRISLVLAESRNDHRRHSPRPPADLGGLQAGLERASREWLAGRTQVQTDSLILQRVLARSLQDLGLLRSREDGHQYFAAGVPWFATLFGRDSVITALQTLAFDPGIAEQTLRVLAAYQGQKVDDWRDEQPGKILHELRVGELAHLGEIPHTPYYGTVDATPLFLILVGRHAAWTGSLRLFHDLRHHIEQALAWMTDYGDSDHDGYIEYRSASVKGLVNQGWKDSGDAIVNADGSLATPPIALVEVQAYAYLARIELAALYERAGDAGRADRLRREAEDLRQRFNRDYWREDLGTYALALQAQNRPCDVVSSNPGHALWAGIAEPEQAARTVQRLMAEDMFSGWGVRTLSRQAMRYNPVGYHLGTVWPHDNSLIAAGFRRYGFDDAAQQIFDGILEAATYFEEERLPELFAGFRKEDYGAPVRYPVACHPQAWAAGSMPYLVTIMLGLTPEGLDRRLRVVRPVLPDIINRLDVRNLRVADASVDLRFQRMAGGAAAVEVLGVRGDLDVVVEP